MRRKPLPKTPNWRTNITPEVKAAMLEAEAEEHENATVLQEGKKPLGPEGLIARRYRTQHVPVVFPLHDLREVVLVQPIMPKTVAPVAPTTEVHTGKKRRSVFNEEKYQAAVAKRKKNNG